MPTRNTPDLGGSTGPNAQNDDHRRFSMTTAAVLRKIACAEPRFRRTRVRMGLRHT